jgi:hypothetical protein
MKRAGLTENPLVDFLIGGGATREETGRFMGLLKKYTFLYLCQKFF